MQYYFPFKTWSLAIIKLMCSMCLNLFKEAWWEDKGKEEGSESKPRYGYRAKAMHNIEARKSTLSSGPSLCRDREQGTQVEGAAWELLRAGEAFHTLIRIQCRNRIRQ